MDTTSMQAPLLFDSWLDALKDDVRAAGGSKAVAAAMWPGLDVDKGRLRLTAMLNESRRERLDYEEERHIIRMAVAARGYSAAMAYLADDCGFEPPTVRMAQDERARLQRDFVEAVRLQQRLVARMEQLAETAAWEQKLQVAK